MKTQSKVLKWGFVLGIIIVLNLFFNYAISLIYKEPSYEDFYKAPQVVPNIDTKEKCLAIGGQWIEGNTPSGSISPTVTIPAKVGGEIQNYCNQNYTKDIEFRKLQEDYNRNVFIILAVLGVIVLILGIFIASEVVSLALSWGGVLSLIIASIRYWSSADNLVKVIILAVALGALIWFAIKKFSDKQNEVLRS